MQKRFTRRSLLLSAFLGSFARYSYAAQEISKPIAGAIRWDAWYSRKDESVIAQNNLFPKEFRARAPLHCRVQDNAELDCEGNQAIMDAEIVAAKKAGLSYWAFDWYSETSSFRRAWDLYQSSAVRSQINWCAIVSLDQLGAVPFGSGQWRAQIDRWAKLMSQANYQKVGKSRPVLYIYYREDEAKKYLSGRTENLQFVFSYLQEKLGGVRPYIVIFNPSVDLNLLRASGADATSNYIAGFQRRKFGSYSDLAAQTQNYWQKMLKSGSNVVPIAQIGWDTRPRLEHPVPWEHTGSERQDVTQYYAIAKPEEFAQHIKSAISFMRDNAVACPYGLMLIYSWDECDEGGCMMPSLGDPIGSYITALSSVLAKQGR